jgi:DNA topoisomerase IB
MKLDPWFYYNLPGETLVENSKTHGTSSNFNKPPAYGELYTEVYNMQQQSSHLRNKLHIV